VIAPHLKQGCIVTDVGSTKGDLVPRMHRRTRAAHARFVGAHPMAGSEKTGWENASPPTCSEDAFVLSRHSLQPTPQPLKSWPGSGATSARRVTTLPPDEHDEIVAHISHLPQVLATSPVHLSAPRDRRNGATCREAGSATPHGIAASDASMWVEILRQQPGGGPAGPPRTFRRELEGFHAALANSGLARNPARGSSAARRTATAFRP
jgi:prephenate dehydrogenase